MRVRRCIALLVLLAMVLALVPGAAYAEPPTGPCDGRDAIRNSGNHFWTPIDQVAPACTEAGYITYRCAYCNQTYTETVPALGHDWNHTGHTDPTCTEDGLDQYVCQRDHSHQYENKVPALGHDWTEWYVVKEPSLAEEGIEERKCQRCGLTEQRPIPMVGQKDAYSLALVMHQTDPAGNTFAYEDLFGAYGITIWYDATLINTGTLPLSVSNFFASDGTEGSLKPPLVLYPGESASDSVLRDLTEFDIIPGSASETMFGATVFDFCFVGDSLEGEKHVCTSNTVVFEYRVKAPEGFDEWDIPSDSTVSVWKTLDNSPADPNGWQLGETLYYTLYVQNTGDLNIEGLVLYDDMYGYGEEALAAFDLAIGETKSAFFQHTVTLQDVNNGYISNFGVARWLDPGDGEPLEQRSADNTVVVINKASLVLQKSVVGGPANGQYYVPGEIVHFQVHVWNNSNVHHKDIMVVDPLVGEHKVCADLPQGASELLDFYYEVTEMDAFTGYVENYAYAMEVDNAVSNVVRVDTGFDGPFGVITALEVIKTETSTYTNGFGYELGDTITYEITVTNTGETLITEGTVHDSLKEGSGEIGAFENLYPQTSRTYTFSHVVTEQDVHAGKVVNQAAVWYDLGGHGAVQTSNEVESPTWGEDPYGFEQDETPLLGGDDFCTRALTGKGNATDAFTVHFCGEHLELLEALEERKAAFASEEEYLKAARTAWQEAMDQMYEKAAQKADSVTAAALMNQRLAWLEYMSTYEALLASVCAQDPLTVERELVREMQNKCVDLCYELHEAPKPRVDSVLNPVESLPDAVPGENCVRVEGQREAAELKYTEILCVDHTAIDQRVMTLLRGAANKDARTNVFLRAQRMWQTPMDARTNARYKAADTDTKALIAKNRKAFDKYLNARKGLLTALYPDRPDVVAQVVARVIQDKEMDLCGLWK